jgi:acyl-CoA thioesterase
LAIQPWHYNALGIVQGGAIFTLADYAFAAASNAHGTVAVGINVSITYMKPATTGVLTAKAREVALNPKLASYTVDVTDDAGELVAVFQGLVYRKKQTIEPRRRRGETKSHCASRGRLLVQQIGEIDRDAGFLEHVTERSGVLSRQFLQFEFDLRKLVADRKDDGVRQGHEVVVVEMLFDDRLIPSSAVNEAQCGSSWSPPAWRSCTRPCSRAAATRMASRVSVA